jgi:hypothetical protein
MIEIVNCQEFERVDFLEVFTFVRYLYHKYEPMTIYIESSAVSFIRTLQQASHTIPRKDQHNYFCPGFGDKTPISPSKPEKSEQFAPKQQAGPTLTIRSQMGCSTAKKEERTM